MAIKEYSYKKHKNLYCSAHTKVKEMRSKDGADKILISENLMIKIEELFARMRCSKYIITSGYRTPSHDIKVGGNGIGQHTLGKAVDARFYDSRGKIIPAQVVCCVAQDIGFTGIANISSKYQNVHLDVRASGIYRGDEIYGTNSVTDDFYKYFSLSAEDIAKYTGDETPEYFKKYSGNTVSIVSALCSIGEKSSFSFRKKIAEKNGIKNYSGTAAQNITMLSLLKKGVLKKP
ncbi:MAG: hypothetical protein E7550_05000 [Ruminococcaceae bacterium]|nr:hypothetical protein [Oscillospiraceae bacterium]